MESPLCPQRGHGFGILTNYSEVLYEKITKLSYDKLNSTQWRRMRVQKYSSTCSWPQPHVFAALPQMKQLSKSNWIWGWVYSGADPVSIIQHVVSHHIDWALLGRIIGTRRKLQYGEVRFAPGTSRIQKKSVHDYTAALDEQSIINLFLLTFFTFYICYV